MKRGLVIPSSTIIKDSGQSTRIGGQISAETIRHWLLFWDEFNCPDNNFIGTGLPPDLQYLEQLGMLRRNFVKMSGAVSSGNFGKIFLAAQHITHAQLNNVEPGKWTVASSEGIVTTNATPSFEPQLIFDLVNVFQIPEKVVSLDDILEFKSKRQDELAAFHSHLEDIYARITASRDVIRSKTVEIQNLESSLKDYNLALAERFPHWIVRSLRVVLDRSLIETAGMGMAGAGFAPLIGLSSLGFGVFAASATFVLRNVLTSDKSTKTPLTYVSNVTGSL